MNLTDKNVLVFGTGLSGIAAAKLLLAIGAKPLLYDGNEQVESADVRAKLGHDQELPIIIGQLPEAVVRSLALVVLSPGVPGDLPLVEKLRAQQLPIWGEVELAYRYGRGDVLAITGTNGKTTTTSLLGEIIKTCRESVFVVGNIGTPYTQVALEMQEDTVTVAEISSFQLETTEEFHPRVSAILNITPDHLNRHHTMAEYIRVKERITARQNDSDTCVLNYEDEILREFGKTLPCQVLFFSSQRTLEKGIYLDGDQITYSDGSQKTVICSTREVHLPGVHNHENIMAAVAMALVYGVPAAVIRTAVKAFQAVEHRIEFVAEKDGVVYYNDSKGTNPDAAIKAVAAMDRPTLLIGGGYDKDSSYDEWAGTFAGRVKYLVLLGETKEKIAAAARKCGFEKIIFADTLEEAVRICADKAQPGDAVLLSPACASWDMFSSYEVRGRKFKEYVIKL